MIYPPPCITQDDDHNDHHLDKEEQNDLSSTRPSSSKLSLNPSSKPSSSSNPPYSKPSSKPSPSSDHGWLSCLVAQSPRNATKNYHRSTNKIVVGSRVMKRIGAPLEGDLTKTGRKRKAFVGGTVISVGSGKSK